MLGLTRKLTATVAAAALVGVSGGATAATPTAVSQPSVQQATAAASTNPWLALSAMTSSSSSAATAAAAAQGDSGPGFPPAPPLAVILGTVALAVWILLHDDHGHLNIEPISP